MRSHGPGDFYPALPERIRHVGPYQEAVARLAGRAQPNLATQLVNLDELIS
jgi:hypothetical protein